jgi:hypothetical protein
VAVEFDFLGDASRGLFQIERDFRTHVSAAAPPGAAAEHVAEAKHVPEGVENVLHVLEPGVSTASREAGMTIAIISRPLVRIAENLIGLGCQLEAGSGLRIIRIAVRVVLDGQLAVSRGDFSVGSVPLHAQHFVVFGFCSHGRRHFIDRRLVTMRRFYPSIDGLPDYEPCSQPTIDRPPQTEVACLFLGIQQLD